MKTPGSLGTGSRNQILWAASPLALKNTQLGLLFSSLIGAASWPRQEGGSASRSEIVSQRTETPSYGKHITCGPAWGSSPPLA